MCRAKVSRSQRCSRMSLTILRSLAYAELYLTLAAIVRRFTLSLYETDYSDIQAVCDAMMPLPKAESKGVRVMVA